MPIILQLHHDNGYGFSGILSVIICKHRLAELRWRRVFKIHFQYTQSAQKLGNDFQFSKIDFKTEFEKKYLNGQKTNLLFEAGFAIGDIPLTHLYNTSQITLQKNHYSKNHLSGKIVLKRCTSTSFSQLSSCISNLNMASIESLFSKK
jgi:hypothetical protein